MIDFQMIFGMDKLMHVIGFAAISAMIGMFILNISDRDRVKNKLRVIWFTLVTIGIIEEYRQFFDRDRSTEFLDAIANIVGVTIGIVITLGISYFLSYKQQVISNVFRLYPMVLILLLIGLLYLNERPFLTMDVPSLERIKSLAAMFGF